MIGRASGDQRVFDALAATYVALVEATHAVPARPGQRRTGPPGGGFGREPDCAWGWAPVAMPDINRVVAPRLAGSPAVVEARIDAINAHFGILPFTWWLDPGATPGDLAETLGWVVPRSIMELVPVMALDLTGDGVRDERFGRLTPGISVALGERSDELVEAELLAARGFGAADEEAAPFASMFADVTAPPDGPLIVAVARLDGRPAATALGIVRGEHLGGYNVATLPDVRRGGLGRAAAAAVLVEGRRRGARTAVLESTAQGVGLYRALGFRDAGHALVVTSPGS